MTKLWKNALQRVSERISPQNYELWLRPIECTDIAEDKVHLKVPNPYIRAWFESNYQDIVLEELRREKPGNYQLRFEVDATVSDAAFNGSTNANPSRANGYTAAPTMNSPAATLQDDGVTTAGEAAHRISNAKVENIVRELGLNPRHTFDTFVAGPSNQFGATAAQKMAETDPPPFNPLFLCGGAGLGKTHLLHAIGYRKLQLRPDSKVVYISGERFMNEFIHSIRTDKMPDFRRRYREECDVLLLDDIQFIAAKESTQEEFFHTFNALHERGRQIVLSADRKPIEIPNFADRLRTRFSMGLIVDILPPDFEVRVAILRKKAADDGIPLPDEVSIYIAENIKSNVRELEGALNRLAAYASLNQCTIDLEFAKRTLEGIISRPNIHLTVDQVMKTVANYYGVKLSDLKSSKRHKAIIGPRAIAMYLARKHTGESYPDLGRSFGDKHHTSVLSACQKIGERLQKEVSLRNEIEAIENQLTR